MRKFALSVLATLALGACTPMTADHLLFSVADQTGPAPFTEGIWVSLDENCTREMAMRRTLPRDCHPLTLSQDSDGGWRLSGTERDQHGTERSVDVRFIVTSAVGTSGSDAYSPLYVAEYPAGALDADTTPQADIPNYAAIAPIGGMPAKEVFVVGEIDCAAILREGPIDGLTEQRDGSGSVSSCVAHNQAAVREAARRAFIEGFADFDDGRLLWVRAK